jgi:putative transposase
MPAVDGRESAGSSGSNATFYKRRSKYDGMKVSDARKLKPVEDENRKLKKLLAESMLGVSTLWEMLGKNF